MHLSCNKIILLTTLLLVTCANFAQGSSAIWDQVSTTIDQYAGLTNCYVVVGDSTGMKYTHSKGNSTWTTYYPVASASKWITSLTTFRMIEAGYFNLSSKPQDFIRWWTNNTSDLRSQMNVSQLLSFTSGFGSDNDCVGDSLYTLEQCAMKIYNESFSFTPGTTYYYGGNHMTVLGYMASVILGQDWNSIFYNFTLQYLPIPAVACKYFPISNPNPAGGLTTNVQYYYQLLQAIYANTLLPANWTSVMEQDQTTNVLMLYSPSKVWGEAWHYCSGHWLECNQSTWSNVCYQTNIHSSPGKFGFYPWIDYPNDYFAIIGTRDADGGTSVQLGYEIKPLINQALSEERASPSASPSRTPSSLSSPSTSPSRSPSRSPVSASSVTPTTSRTPSPSAAPARTPSSVESSSSTSSSVLPSILVLVTLTLVIQTTVF